MSSTDNQITSPWLTEAQAATYLSIHPGTLRKYRALGTGPKYFKLGTGRFRYLSADLDAWLKPVLPAAASLAIGDKPSPDVTTAIAMAVAADPKRTRFLATAA